MVKLVDAKLKKEISEKLELSGFSEKEKDEIVLMLLDNISAKLNLAIMERLTESEREETQKILEDEKLIDFLSLKINDLPELIDKTAKEVVEEFQRMRKN